MKAKKLIVIGMLVLCTAFALPALAQTGGGSELTWLTIDGGGGTSTGGGYSLSGTIGQPEAGALSGGGYVLDGGFWAGGANRYAVYLPLVVR